MITKAWAQRRYRNRLLNHSSPFAKNELESRGIILSHPVVLTEEEYDAGWVIRHPDEVVFVLPKKSRTRDVPPGQLLETAKMLMACVPNGI